MRIPITMSHGTDLRPQMPVTVEHLDALFVIAAEMGFTAINYDQLDAWRRGETSLPRRPIMFDFDHALKSMRDDVHPVLARYGFRGNLFIHTGPLDEMYAQPLPADGERRWMTWEEIGRLMEQGWHIGAHTVTHPNLSELSMEDPDGARLRQELEQCDQTLREKLGVTPRDFAYTGTSFSTAAEREVARRYRFGRLWIVGANYEVDGATRRYADLVGVVGPDEADGGPPAAARYITADTPAYRLPSMEIRGLIYEPAAFRRYLEQALDGQ